MTALIPTSLEDASASTLSNILQRTRYVLFHKVHPPLVTLLLTYFG